MNGGSKIVRSIEHARMGESLGMRSYSHVVCLFIFRKPNTLVKQMHVHVCIYATPMYGGPYVQKV